MFVRSVLILPSRIVRNFALGGQDVIIAKRIVNANKMFNDFLIVVCYRGNRVKLLTVIYQGCIPIELYKF